jgi:membrane protein implicated in regulation of membrane protease activity
METQDIPQLTAGETESPEQAQGLSSEQKKTMTIVVIVLVILLAAFIGGLVFLMTTSLATVARVRDIFIIFMALQSLLIGLALVILMVQMARLINLVQNEIKPILDSTNETVSHLRGTTVFLSDNLVAPVIKLNEYLAGFAQLLQVIGLARKPSKSKPPKGE